MIARSFSRVLFSITSTPIATPADARSMGVHALALEPKRCVERLAGGGWKRAYLFALPLELHELCLAIHLVLYMDLKANTL